MIIDEISENLIPLERSANKAIEYKNAIAELENVEVALIVKDITTFNAMVEEKSINKTDFENELFKVNTNSSTDNTR